MMAPLHLVQALPGGALGVELLDRASTASPPVGAGEVDTPKSGHELDSRPEH